MKIVYQIILTLALFTLTVADCHAADVRRTKSGIIIIGKGDSVRAVEPFRGLQERGINYAWNGTAWDPLGELFALESITNEEIDSLFE